MARIGGRNTWLAFPASLLCAAIVAALLWLSLPMMPVAVAWVGDSLRSATARAEASPATEATGGVVDAGGGLDCRDLYPDDLWVELVWTPQALLAQTTAPPATGVAALTDALAPVVERTCTWNADKGTVTSTLAQVGADAITVADAALRGQGFACTQADGGLECSRTEGDVIEEHTIRAGLWLSSVETSWHPEDYGSRLAAFVWG
ncbi:hypothetical protein [Microbacterium terricola]|uniref:Uncharacterized protein n=1 Tax=Microbacterium terricola TaxID=344163 RepID=A0ABM8DVZ8_9MICO|nr:hypothetical protein [Microbacterium terricola]UYK39574.1 hypothetical protein OAU46_12830 [Microbacterium terricola]BDV29690.1 hypothetical protein Microterr_03500 [Microbacterium terricola]